MEPASEDKKIDIADLQKEVIEMRQQIPAAYRHALEKDFERFKKRLTNIIAQRGSIPHLQAPDITIDSGLFNSTVPHTEEELRQYIENAEMFVKKMRKDGDKWKKFLY